LELNRLHAQCKERVNLEKENMELRRRLDELQHRIRMLMNRRAMLEEQRQTDIANWEAMQRKAAGMRHDFGKHSGLYGEVEVYKEILEGCRHKHVEKPSPKPLPIKPPPPPTPPLPVPAPVVVEKPVYVTWVEKKTKGMHLGRVAFQTIEYKGRYITIKNVSAHLVSLDRWKIVQKDAQGRKVNRFRFPNGITLRPGHTITIWSNNENQSNTLPNHLVYRKGRWGTEKDHLTTLLYDEFDTEPEGSHTPKNIWSSMRLPFKVQRVGTSRKSG